MLVGLAAGMALAALLNRGEPWANWGAVAVIGSIPAIWPRFHWPGVEVRNVPELLSIGFALTIVAFGQSISIAKAVSARSGQPIDANREFRGQGLSNIVGGFFSSCVSCGSLNRSLPNLEAGARTPLTAVFASLWLLLLVASTASLLALIPLPAIAARLVVVAWALLDVPRWRHLWQHSREDFAIAAVTALATVTIRLEVAILLGTILSRVVYLHRTSRPAMRVLGFDKGTQQGAPSDRHFVVRTDVPRHLLVMAKGMNFNDLSATELWRTELDTRRAAGGDLNFHRPRPPVLELWQRVGFTRDLGVEHIFAPKRAAIATIFERLDRGICARCTARVFEECQSLPPPR